MRIQFFIHPSWLRSKRIPDDLKEKLWGKVEEGSAIVTTLFEYLDCNPEDFKCVRLIKDKHD